MTKKDKLSQYLIDEFNKKTNKCIDTFDIDIEFTEDGFNLSRYPLLLKFIKNCLVGFEYNLYENGFNSRIKKIVQETAQMYIAETLIWQDIVAKLCKGVEF